MSDIERILDDGEFIPDTTPKIQSKQILNQDIDFTEPLVKSDFGIVHTWSPEVAKMVYHLASCGTPFRALVNAIGLSKPSIMKYYRDAYEAGMAEAERVVAKTVFTLASNPENGAVGLKAAQYWLGVRAGWRDVGAQDRIAKQVAGENGTPLGLPHIDLSKLTDDQLDQLQQLIAAAEISEPGDNETQV